MGAQLAPMPTPDSGAAQAAQLMGAQPAQAAQPMGVRPCSAAPCLGEIEAVAKQILTCTHGDSMLAMKYAMHRNDTAVA
jgi:hypothetical protein